MKIKNRKYILFLNASSADNLMNYSDLDNYIVMMTYMQFLYPALFTNAYMNADIFVEIIYMSL